MSVEYLELDLVRFGWIIVGGWIVGLLLIRVVGLRRSIVAGLMAIVSHFIIVGGVVIIFTIVVAPVGIIVGLLLRLWWVVGVVGLRRSIVVPRFMIGRRAIIVFTIVILTVGIATTGILSSIAGGSIVS